MVATFVTFLHLEPSSPNHRPRRQAKFQLWSCAHLAPSIFAEIYPGCYRSTAPRCAARQLFDFQASAITSDRLLRRRAEALCCMRKTLQCLTCMLNLQIGRGDCDPSQLLGKSRKPRIPYSSWLPTTGLFRGIVDLGSFGITLPNCIARKQIWDPRPASWPPNM